MCKFFKEAMPSIDVQGVFLSACTANSVNVLKMLITNDLFGGPFTAMQRVGIGSLISNMVEKIPLSTSLVGSLIGVGLSAGLSKGLFMFLDHMGEQDIPPEMVLRLADVITASVCYYTWRMNDNKNIAPAPALRR